MCVAAAVVVFMAIIAHASIGSHGVCVKVKAADPGLLVQQGMEGALVDVQELLDKEIGQAGFRW